jgi:hypothetical protein
MAEAPGLRTDRRFDHAANDSPRSGSSKRMTPLMWSVVIIVAVALTIWFATAQ